jgi:hypothetical protein
MELMKVSTETEGWSGSRRDKIDERVPVPTKGGADCSTEGNVGETDYF